MTNEKQLQTKETFSFLWKLRDSYESRIHKKKYEKWLVDRYFGTEEERVKFIEQYKGKEILDAGCGSGFSAILLFGNWLNNMSYFGVDISDAIAVAKTRFEEQKLNGSFSQENI